MQQIFIFLTVWILSGLLCPPLAVAQKNAQVHPDWPYVTKRLKQAGLKRSFIKALRENYDTKDFKQVVELNVLLYLRKTDYHGPQVNKDAVQSVDLFLLQYRSSLDTAEKIYGVSAEVIGSLLWMETRFGENLGRFHVPSVFVHLLQAERPEVVSYLSKDAAKNFTKDKITKKIRREIAERTKKKAKWAIEELKALQTMQQKYGNNILKLSGSFSGAFGMPQFIPSSYVTYASSEQKRGAPDLTQAPDSIHSVANYLKKNGWQKGQRKTFSLALFKYNNSHDYGNAILNLAGQTSQISKTGSKRKPASTKTLPKSKGKLNQKRTAR